MSKFIDVNNKNNSDNINITQQNSGGQNLQYTKIEQNTTHNHYNNSNNNKDNSEFFGLVIAGIFCILFAIYFLFSNYEKIYLILKVGAISSPLFAVFSLVILLKRNEIEKNDIVRFISSLILSIMILFLIEFLNTKTPEEIIMLSKKSKSFFDFWKELSEYGKNISVSITASCLLIIISIILNHLLAIRTFFYALANTNKTGFWYSMFNFMHFFKFRISGSIIIVLSVLTILILDGYIFHIG